MPAPTIKVFSLKERPTAEDLNTIYSTLAGKFGSLQGDDFFYPFISNGDIDLAGNRLLRAREIFGILNMEEFGTDETAFDNAINDLELGGVILIPRNVSISLTRGIKVRNNRARIYIVGCGHSSQIVMANNADDNAITFDGSQRFRVMNLFLNGNRDNNFSGNGIQVRDSTDFEISNCWIGDSSTTGFKNNGILISKSDHFSIKRCWIRNPYRSGIVVDSGSSSFNVTQNLVDMTNNPENAVGEHGIVVSNDCMDGVVEANTCRNIAWDGIVVDSSKNIRVCNNVVRGFGKETSVVAERSGIAVLGLASNRRAEGTYVFGNILTGGQTGLTVSSHVWASAFIGNYLRGNSVRPIFADSSTQSSFVLRSNVCMEVSPNGRVTFTNAVSVTRLTVGVSGLPIQAIHATWDVVPVSNLKNSVLGARYNGNTVWFYNSSALAGSNTAWYTIET